MQCFSYFSTLIYHDYVDVDLLAVEATASRYIAESISTSDIDKSRYIVQTRDLSCESSISHLTEYFYNNSINFLNRCGYATDRYNFFVSAWAQNIENGQYNDFHTHRETCISGIYFITSPEDGSYVEFQDPRPGKNMASLDEFSSNCVTPSTQYIHYKDITAPGLFVIFDSWLEHKISRNFSSNPVKIIHFCLHQQRKL